MNYPHDEFDDVPENSERRGTYRGVLVDSTRSNRSFFAMIGAGLVGLVIGAIMFIYSPQLSAPDSSAQAAAQASSPVTPTAEATASNNKVAMMYNGGAYQGAAGQAATVLGNEGYSIPQVANWQGTEIYYSTVYYAEGRADEADKIAQMIGATYIQEDPTIEVPFVIVLAADYAGIPQPGEELVIYDITETNGSADNGAVVNEEAAGAGEGAATVPGSEASTETATEGSSEG